MARTQRKDCKLGKALRDGEVHSLYYRREAGVERKLCRRKLRKQSRQQIRALQDWDGIMNFPIQRGTQGWLGK